MPPLPPGLVLALLLRVAGATGQIRFHAPLFASGMILQRDAPTKIWGNSTNLDDAVTVYVLDADGETVLSNATAQSDHATGAWVATLPLPGVPAKSTTQVMAMDSDGNTAYLESVAWGDVLLCGGQSNMGFGMCGATVIATGPSPQTPTQALAALPTENPLRFYNQQGDRNGGAGSTVKGNVCSDPCTTSNNRYMHWYNASKDNAGSASAVCLLTAQKLRASLGGMVPVGAVESCVGGTPVAPWTPPSGSLYTAHIEPLLPMRFLAALWDQGERDAKTTNTTWYSTEFPAMIQAPDLPFVYVELCHELGAAEPKEKDFWQFGQRAALRLPKVGFATTTDVDKSALHPPDKQDIATRLDLEVRRLALGQHVVARGPELISASYNATSSELTVRFTNASLVVYHGIVVPPPLGGCHVPPPSAFLPPADHGGEPSVVATPQDPLACFAESAPGAPCYCDLEYPVHLPRVQTPEACAAECLKSTEACVSFLFQHRVNSTSGNPSCRLSHTCRTPDKASKVFRGFMRNCSDPSCGRCPPLPPPPPPTPPPPTLGPSGGVVMQYTAGKFEAVPFKVDGDSIVVKCTQGTEAEPVLINGDASICFLYSKDSGLPAPPLSLPCSAAAAAATADSAIV